MQAQSIASKFTHGKGCGQRKLSDTDRQEIVRLYLTPLPDGTWMGAPTIARRFGVRHPVIYRELQRAGVESRTASIALTGKPSVRKRMSTGAAPECKCGCGDITVWNQRKGRWNVYVDGHYRQAASYKDREWLLREYVDKRRTMSEIAAEFGVGPSSICKAMRAAGVPRRDGSDAHVGRQVGADNPAWRGGVANWDYSHDWKRIARTIRDRDEWTCQLCGDCRTRWGNLLHVHHIDSDKLNNSPTNLISLCFSCHPRGREADRLASELTALAAAREGVVV